MYSLLLLVCAATMATSERCLYTTVAFRTKYTYAIANPEHERWSNAGKHCSDFGADYNPLDQSYGRNTYEGMCKIKVCGDGRKHDGYYCGRGPCNMFGHNCDGGCISGDAAASFKQIHTDKVWDVYTI
ncbi:hypothetical protein F8203_gp092 [Heliothis virescens ascovirus 3f]|uniref:Uncharacterized protein n=1 Tax=Heliothis virescens ascovirus 3f TaxID=328614 RepID=A0A171PVH1_9VIRU|nr:hypothetical protein F8203_gp092 [Heliothis virescens ascovirus 3f]AJP09058.1 hypothetical protein [Heliothis virescens ascovirus 3f]